MAKQRSNRETSAFAMQNFIVSEETIRKHIDEMKEEYKKEKKDLLQRHIDEAKNYRDDMPSQVQAWWASYVPHILMITIITIFTTAFVQYDRSLWPYGFSLGIFTVVAIAIIYWMRVLGQTERSIVERLGSFHRVLRHGVHFIIYPMDKIINTVSIEQQTHQLYQDERRNDINFSDSSAPITAYMRYRITNAVRFTYSADNPIIQMEERINAIISLLFQYLNIDSVNEYKNLIAQSIAEMLKDEFEKIYGVTIETILITDIIYSEESKKLRQERLVGTVAAQREASVGAGYASAIAALKKQVKEDLNENLSYDEAERLYLQMQALDTVKQTGANISFVASDIKGVLKMLDIKGEK